MEVSILTCKFCGAQNPATNQRCFSCDAPLAKPSALSDKDKQSLSNYIKSVNDMLKASQTKADKKIFPAFIVLSVIGIISILLFYFWLGKSHHGLFVTISIIWGLVLFTTFGFYVTKYHNQTMSAEFKQKIKFEIQDYLNQMNFTEADFKTTAAEILDEKSPLINFLPEL